VPQYPAESDVREGTVFGPADEYLGTLVVGVLPEPDLSEGNLSLFEESEVTSLNSYYVGHGIDAEYYDKANDEARWLKVCLVDRLELIEYEGEIQYEHETITVLVRRYAGTDHYAVDRFAKGDRLSLPSFDGTRKYTLTQTPVKSSGQLEWKAEFSRSKRVGLTNKEVVKSSS
jgi:hypothetical protein